MSLTVTDAQKLVAYQAMRRIYRPVPDGFCYRCGRLAARHEPSLMGWDGNEVCDLDAKPWTVRRAALHAANNVVEVLGLPAPLDDWGSGDQAFIRAIAVRLTAWADASAHLNGAGR